MLVTLGARNQLDDLVDVLAACHRRIRQHVVLARRLATDGAACPPEEVAETAARVRRYFTVALPLHILDEDDAIAPRLAGRDPVVDDALARMHADHRNHDRLIARLVAHCAALEVEPASLASSAAPLGALVELLATELSAHLELEERVIFPALRMLPRTVRDDIHAGIKQRRAAAS